MGEPVPAATRQPSDGGQLEALDIPAMPEDDDFATAPTPAGALGNSALSVSAAVVAPAETSEVADSAAPPTMPTAECTVTVV